MSNLLEILKAATEDLANSPSATDVALRTTQLLQQIKEIQPHIMKHAELASILAYKCLRSLQEIDFLNVAFRLENRPANKQFQIVTSQLREILTPIFKENVDLSVSCGREFLRLALDRPLICEFNANFRLEPNFKWIGSLARLSEVPKEPAAGPWSVMRTSVLKILRMGDARRGARRMFFLIIAFALTRLNLRYVYLSLRCSVQCPRRSPQTSRSLDSMQFDRSVS
jgi:hypothetical protein